MLNHFKDFSTLSILPRLNNQSGLGGIRKINKQDANVAIRLDKAALRQRISQPLTIIATIPKDTKIDGNAAKVFNLFCFAISLMYKLVETELKPVTKI